MFDVGDELGIFINLETISSVIKKNWFTTESKIKTALNVSTINKLYDGILEKSLIFKLDYWFLETLKTDLVVIEYIWDESL